MSKTLAIILHYNSTKYTDTLYELLKPYEKDDYELIVIDNGSDLDKTSKYSSFRIEENCYYGGGLDVCMNYFLENEQYDSLIVLNSDLIIQGHNFIKELRRNLFKYNHVQLTSACIIQPGLGQCYWPQMHCWNSTVPRKVEWVDYQCVLLKREFVEYVKSFNSKYGWVQDIMSGIICKNKNWSIEILDWLPAIHIGNGSINDNLDKPDIANYNTNAEKEMWQYFEQKGLLNELIQLRNNAKTYEWRSL